jgi:hypothetical protein
MRMRQEIWRKSWSSSRLTGGVADGRRKAGSRRRPRGESTAGAAAVRLAFRGWRCARWRRLVVADPGVLDLAGEFIRRQNGLDLRRFVRVDFRLRFDVRLSLVRPDARLRPFVSVADV